jgi:hypothetical protein
MLCQKALSTHKHVHYVEVKNCPEPSQERVSDEGTQQRQHVASPGPGIELQIKEPEWPRTDDNRWPA